MARPVKPGAEWIRFKPPAELRKLIEDTAAEEGRYLTQEVIYRLKRAYAHAGKHLARSA